MRVLHLVKDSIASPWAKVLVRRLVAEGHELHVALPFGGHRVEQYRSLGVEVHDLAYPVGSPREMVRNGRQLQALVRRIQPQIIHSWFAQTTLYMRSFLRNAKIPRVFQVVGPLHLESPRYRTMDIWSANRWDWWIPTSRFIQQIYLDAGVPEDRLRLAYCPTDLTFYEPRPAGWLRARYGIPSDKRIIGMVAHIYPPHWMLRAKRGVKGHEDLIDAFALLQQRRDDVVLVIGGKAWMGAVAYEQQIHAYAHERCGDAVIFTGWVEDVRDVFADLDVFVYPSHSENLGGVFESLLLGVPTVGSRVGGIPEAVVDGETGLLVDPNAHGEIADAIEVLLDDRELAEAFAAKGRPHILATMDLDRSVSAVTELYSELAGR